MKKSVITLLIFLIMIISVSAVSAADDASDLVASDDATVSVANTDTAVTADRPVENFTELDHLIANTPGSGELTLSSNYERNGSETNITIDMDKIINGNGSYIDGKDKTIFEIAQGKSVTLKNMILKNSDNNPAIINRGTLTLDNVTFDNVGSGVENYGDIYLSNNVISNKPIVNLAANTARLTSPCTVEVSANIKAGDWKTIEYEANVLDDNDNLVSIADTLINTWKVKINNVPVTNMPTYNTGGIRGEEQATSYGKQVVSASNILLTNPTINTKTVFVTPGKQKSNITLEPDTTVWNDTVTFTVTIENYTDDSGLGVLYPTGTINLAIDGATPITLELVNGSANYTIDNVQVKSYSIRIDYSGDDFFNATDATGVIKTFVVNPIKPTINITVDNSTVGQQVITIELPSDATGVINATISKGTEVVEKYTNKGLTEGKYILNTQLAASDKPYSIHIDYTPVGTTKYAANDNDTTFYADKFTPEIIIAIENNTYGNNVTFTVTANGVDNVTYKIFNGGTEVKSGELNLTNGVASADVGVIAASENYKLQVTTIPNAVYKVNSTEVNFKVAKATPVVDITIGDYSLFEQFEINVTVTVGGANGATVNVTDNGVNKDSKKLDENCTATLNYTIESIGNHEVKVKYISPANSNYTDYESEAIVIDVARLTPTIIVDVGEFNEVNIGKNAKVNITVKGHDNTHVPAGSVTVEFADFSKVETLSAGNATVTIDSSYINALGYYTITVKYSPSDNYYNPNSTTYMFEVVKWDVPIIIQVANFTVKDNITVNVTAGELTTDANPYPAFTENFTVTIVNLDDEISIKLTNGITEQLNYTLPAGEYAVEVLYVGDDTHYIGYNMSSTFSVKNVIENLTIVVDNVTYPAPATAVVNASADGEYIVYLYKGTENIENYTVTVEDGIGQVILGRLDAAGDYKAIVKSLMYDHVTVTNETTFEVKQGTINATIVIPDVVYGDNITAIVTATVDGVYNLTFMNHFVANVTVENGIGQVIYSLSVPAADGYIINLIAPENANYTNGGQEVNQTTFNVAKANMTVIVTIDEVNYPNQATVVINASAGIDFRVFVNGTRYDKKTDENGTCNVTINQLVPNTYDVTVEADGSQNYNAVSKLATLIVNKGDIKINVTIPDIYYTNDTYVTGTLDVDPVAYNATLGLGYEITIENSSIPAFYLNGNATDKKFNLSVILDPGNYTLRVTPKVNEPAFEYYNVNESSIYYTTQFEVKKGLINFNITVLENPVTYPDSVKVNITTNVTGNYLVTVGDRFEKNVFVVANNNTTVEIPGLDVGFYRVTVTSNNDKYYATEVREANFVVYHGSIEARVDIANVNYYTKPVAVVTSTNANGLFTVIVNHKQYNVTVENGTGNVTIDEILNVGDYSAILTADIEYYNPFRNESASFKVLPAPVNLTIEVTTVGYPNQAVATVYANASGSYNITIEGTDYSKVVEITTTPGTIANATYVIPAVLPVATYKANVTKIDSNPNFEDANATTEFDVTKGSPVIIIDIEKTYAVLSNVTIYITVPYGAYGKVQINDTASATNPIKKDLLLDADGKANFTIEGVEKLGTHVIYVELTENNNFTTTLNQTSFEVTPIATDLKIEWNKTVVYEDDVEIALNITGKLVPGHDPTGRVYIINFTDKAASADEIEFTLSKVAAGDYTLNITYTGDDIYAGCSKLISLTVNKFHPAVNANATGATYPNNATVNFTSNRTGNFSIIVEYAEGTFVKEIPVGIVKNDTVQSVVIDGLAAGNYTAIVVYMPSENYTQSINSTKFEISKSAECTFNADVIDATYPDNATVTAIASEDGAYGIVIFDENNNPIDILYGELVANETAIVGLPQLNAGNYILRIFYGSENYTAKDIIKNLTISKGTPVILIDVTDATYPEHGIVNISCNVDGEYTITVGTFTATGNFTAGEFIAIDVGILAADIYSVDVDYIENENYAAVTRSSWLVIEQATPEIFILVDTTEILENATLLVGIPLATGDFVTINGINVELIDYQGLGEYAEYNIGILKAGVYNFTAVYAGDKNLTAGNETITFTVEKLPSNLVVTVENTTYGTDPIMIVTLDNKENVIVNFVFDDEIEQAGIIKNGSVSGEIVGMAAGDHKVVVTYGGSDVYEADTQTVYYTIDKAPITVEVSADDVVFPDVITVTVKADVSGNYTVAVGSSSEVVTLEADVAQDVIFIKVPGTYDVSISCEESENYTAASAETEVTLEKGEVNIVLVVPDVTYGDDIVAYIEADVAGDYKVQLGDVTQLVTLAPGVVKDVKFAGLDAGDYLVIAKFDETEYYANATVFKWVTVDKAQVDLEITSEDVTYPDSVYVTIYTDIDGEYWLQINMTTPERVTLYSDIPNVFELPNLDAGTYLVSITYTGSENYDTTSDFVFVTVNKVENTTMTVETTSPVAGDNATVTVTLPEDATGIVSVKYGNGVYSAPVVDGVATVSVPTTLPGTEAAEVTYNGDTNYAPASASVDITVAPNGIIIAENIRRGVNSPYDYYVTFVDKDYNPISDVELTFTILGNTFKATTNASGVATIFAGLEVVDGKDTVYDVTVTNPYTMENVTATTTIVPRLIVVSGDLTADYLENPAYVVQAFGDDGNPVGANVTVRIVFAGFYYDMQTNATGHVERTIALAPGSYAVRGEYAGYKTNQTAFRVLQILKASSGTLKKTAKSYTLKATLKHTDGRVIAGATVKLNFNGKTYTVKTNANGVASYTLKSSQIKKLTAGKTYVLKALYVNDWTKGQWQGKIKVVKK